MAVWKFLSPNQPIKDRLIQRVGYHTIGARGFLGNGVLGCSLYWFFFDGELQRPEFSHTPGGGFSGSQSGVGGREKPDVGGGLVEVEKSMIGWF